MNLPPQLHVAIREANATIRFRFPWWLRPFVLRGVAGLTLGRRIYIAGDVPEAEVPALIRHELVYVAQIGRLGILRFLWRYVREYFGNRWRGLPSHEAYRRISLESEAFAAERKETI
jgi:hypothetical protein